MTPKELQISSNGVIHIDQLKDFIMGTIKDKYDVTAKSSLAYVKPYTSRIDSLKMTGGYQPPKFQQFDGKENPKQHIAHFIETCNDVGTYGDYLVKQFVCSLKGNAFDWYTDLEAGSIDSSEQLEHEFLNRFSSTRRTVSMVEHTSTLQWKDEPVIDFINRWRNASLNCKDKLSETSGIEMCIQGMHWGLRYILQGIKPKSVEELAARAHDMELSMSSSKNQGPPVYEPRKGKDKQEIKKGGKFVPKSERKESMNINVSPLKVTTKASKKQSVKTTSLQDKAGRKLTMKEMQAKEYPFLDSDVPTIFEELLELKLIEFPEIKHPDEAGMTNDPNYCKYHWLIGHPIKKCFIFKEKIMDLAAEGKILLGDEKESSNQVSVTFGSLDPIILFNFAEVHECEGIQTTSPPKMIKFGDFEPINVNTSLFLPIVNKVIVKEGSQEKNESYAGQTDDEGWILVTRRRRCKTNSQRESSKQLTKEKMEKRPKKKMIKKDRKKIKMEENHYQRLCRPVTLEEFMPSRLCVQVESYCKVDGEETKKEYPSMLSLSFFEKLTERPFEEVDTCDAKITFTNYDLLLGETHHNCPLFMVGFVCERRVSRILIDDGFSVNILLIHNVKELGTPMDGLCESLLMIQEFNQGGQRAIRAIKLEINMGDMRSSAWIHVIDAKSSYNILLGRPWIHENNVISFTYHQCLKYWEDGVEKEIVVDGKPFTEAESYFANAKFYLKNYVSKEVKVDDVMLTKSVAKKVDVTTGKAKITVEKDQVLYDRNKIYKASSSKKVTHVLRYVPKAMKVEDPFSELQALPTRRTYEVFDPNAYKLLAKAGYDPNVSSKLDKLPPEASNPAQKMMIEKGYPLKQSREGSSYHITIRDKQNASSHMEVEEKCLDIHVYHHTSFNDGDPQEDEDAKNAPPELEEGVKTKVDALKEVNLRAI
ncbi:uncharacterized protein [Nicotiana tomentosiformis]|uniref:uncharacterized protein n=1 Tax=Nicotiana tomentosiformis TaxID=4098 RepID=UPI00388CDEC9